MLSLICFSLKILPLVIAAPELRIAGTTFLGRTISTPLKIDFFGGIPFAEPPVQNLRLAPPILKTKLDAKTFNATVFGKGCPQLGIPLSEISEDCLTLNIYKPSSIDAQTKLPVLFWTYGGGFDSGASFMFDASAIVKQSMSRGTPIIYVSFNYRLGPLGFPQGQEADNQHSLNLGLKDQIAALEWVQVNIKHFGGDKEKVTIFGESAGAIMGAILFLNSPIEKWARAGIFESGSAATALEYNAERREVNWQNFVAGVPSCASLATSGSTFSCLKAANSTEIVSGVLSALTNTVEAFGFEPTIDGPGGILPDSPSNLLAKGRFSRLPFIAGTNLDEGTFFTSRTNLTDDDLRNIIIINYSPPLVDSDVFQATVDELLSLYPDDPAAGSPFDTGANTFGLPSNYKREAAMLGDIGYQAQRRSWIQTASRAGVKTFGYLFTQPQPNGDPALGVPHESEISFVYGAPNDTSLSSARLSESMIDYWVSFATSLDPNDGLGNDRPVWSQYTRQSEEILQLNGDNMTMIPDDYRKQQIDFINSNPAVFHQRRSLSYVQN